ncbi:hypothetical protein [Hahella sp. NBU794]|uniref:hypothetical protein n=1 Tax=Hahella sp. NBU794 TaxID=3422590 RepID=UPI003D6DB240
MTIYRMRTNGSDFQELIFDRFLYLNKVSGLAEKRRYLSFFTHNLSLQPLWDDSFSGSFKPFEGRTGGPIPDIRMWTAGAIVLSPKAYRVLAEAIAPYGELLPVNCEGEIYYLFNCLTMVAADELISQRSVSFGAVVSIEKLSFPPTDAMIFKTDYDNGYSLYCQSALKVLIDQHGLKGMELLEDLSRSFD